MTPCPELKVTRAGIENFEEIRAWAEANSDDWVLVQRWRMTYAWTNEEFLQVLAVTLLVRIPVIPPHDGMRPDPVVPVLYQEPVPRGCRGPLLVGLGFGLILAACVAHHLGSIPWAIGIVTAAMGCMVAGRVVK